MVAVWFCAPGADGTQPGTLLPAAALLVDPGPDLFYVFT